MGQIGHVLRVFLAETTEQCRCQRRVQRRNFQFVGHFARGAVLPLEMVGIDRLRRAVEGVDHFVEQCGGHVYRVQKCAFAQALVRVGCPGTHQQGRAVDAATGQHEMPRLDRDGAPGRCDAAFIHRRTLQAGDLVAADREFFGAGQVKQLTAFFQGRRNGGDHHRLLGVGRAAHAAVSEVPAAANVARDDVP
ncbi:hypothetical protein D3C75_655130 [compost metagenome]